MISVYVIIIEAKWSPFEDPPLPKAPDHLYPFKIFPRGHRRFLVRYWSLSYWVGFCIKTE